MSVQVQTATVIKNVQQSIQAVLRIQESVSADDINSQISIPTGVSRSVIGIAFRLLKQDRVIVECGMLATTRRAGRGHLLRRWRRADHTAPSQGVK